MFDLLCLQEVGYCQDVQIKFNNRASINTRNSVFTSNEIPDKMQLKDFVKLTMTKYAG